MSTTEPIKSKDQVQKLYDYFLKKKQYRNYLLVALGANTALRISDILDIKWSDVYDFTKHEYKNHLRLIEKKTRKEKSIAINNKVKKSLSIFRSYLGAVDSKSYLFSNNRKHDPKPISRMQAYRIIKEAAKAVGLHGNISCHSLRKTYGYHVWQAGIQPPLIMQIYNHSDYEMTKKYLGITQDEVDKIYLSVEVWFDIDSFKSVGQMTSGLSFIQTIQVNFWSLELLFLAFKARKFRFAKDIQNRYK